MAHARHMHPELPVFLYRAEATALRHLDFALDWSLVRLQKPASFSADGTGGAILALARGADEFPPPPTSGPLLKFRSVDRTAFSCLLAYQAYSSGSPLLDLFELPPPPEFWPVNLARYAAAFEAKFGATDDPFLIALFTCLRGLTSSLLFFASRPLLLGVVVVSNVFYVIITCQRRSQKSRLFKQE
eukprot:TRINITY_DN20215_c3_g1_i1.p1 TRINITY_DN20215_c3_g1~~TRINITY_DN20215_c3_g1_i1.p1  ORF type:complete len:196 (+),score=25.86 TRINITY_DN20215_c3_g1_i1:33-590(+)